MRSAWKRLKEFQNRHMDEVTIMELQGVVNETAKEFSKSTVTRLIGLIKGMYRFAVPRELCRKDIGLYIETPKVKEEVHHDSFTDEEINILWRAAQPVDGASDRPIEGGGKSVTDIDDSGNAQRSECMEDTVRVADMAGAGCIEDVGGSVDVAATVRMILTMIYSGFRISAWQANGEYGGMSVDLENMTFTGGVKTAAGKNRVVPIHSAILPLVEGMRRSACGRSDEMGSVEGMDSDQIVFLCGKGQSQFRRDMKAVLEKLGIRQLTPHSCRHTFHRLLERAGVNEADRKRLMGHSLKGDITNGTYGHRGIEELRGEIEKIEREDLSAVA